MIGYAQQMKWLRFDTVTGPVIGSIVIFGVIVLAVL